MYSGFNITEPVGNNAFSYELREGRSIYVPAIINGTLDDLEVGEEIVFEECDENGNILSFNGLKKLVKTELFGIPTYIFDNHNHAFYFWSEAINNGVVESGTTLVHIDEHSDMREPELDLIISETRQNLQDIFNYTNYTLNVGNYIKPAIKAGFIEKVIQVQGEESLNGLLGEIKKEKNDIILNLDIDFFSPEMGYIDFGKSKRIILEVAKKSKLITIATSPFFINQKRAIEIIKNLFG